MKYDFKIASADVTPAINDIKPYAASGPGEVPIVVLKARASCLCKPIKCIWSESSIIGIICLSRISLLYRVFKKTEPIFKNLPFPYFLSNCNESPECLR